MTLNTVHVSATRRSVGGAIAALPAALTHGGSPADAVLLRAGLALLGRVRRAYIARARGGTDEAGGSWAPLKPATIAYGRRGRSRKERGQHPRPSQALSDKQRDSWWWYYRQGLAIYRGDRGRAARRAWGIMKKKGATTLFDKYSKRRVETLRDTGVLLNSLSPGGAGSVMRVESGAVTVGTNVPYAKYHHNGVPGRLPQRRLWPEVNQWPQSWWRDITDQVKQGLADIAAQVIRGAS